MIKCLAAGIEDVALISLDHDLELIPEPGGQLVDPGTGVEVSDWLAAQAPSCPVIIQTTNSRAGHQMEDSLRESGWTVQRIVPYSGADWIYEAWSRSVRDLIVNEIPKSSRHPVQHETLL
ncbi:cyclic-phosphate processing receiver domain-containing protein [Planctomicrobium piriforme]